MRRAASVLFALISASILTSAPMVYPAPAFAAGCVKFIASNFEGSRNDNNYPNDEWVRIKNVCSSSKSIGNWKIHDYQKIHTYKFPSSFTIGAGVSVTLYSGHGDSTRRKRYWGLDSAVWNNAPPEFAYLRKPDGTLMSKWTEY